MITVFQGYVILMLLVIASAYFAYPERNDIARRYMALLIDLLLIFGCIILLENWLYDVVSLSFLLAVITVTLALMESSPYRTSPGKFIFKLAISNSQRTRPSFLNALFRNTIKLVSLFAMPVAIFSGLLLKWKGKSLHDILTGTECLYLGSNLSRRLGNDKIYAPSPQPEVRFNSHEDAGQYGEMLVLNELERLKQQNILVDFGSTSNLVFKGKNFEIDGYALANGIGLVLFETKFYSGKIYPTSKPLWDNIKFNGVNEPKKNPCIQLERTGGLLVDLFDSEGIENIPVYGFVALANHNVELIWGDDSPQHSTGLIVMIEDFFKDHAKDSAIQIDKDMAEKVKQALINHQAEYVDRSAEFVTETD